MPSAPGRKPFPIEDRFWPKVKKSAGCWLWTGSRNGDGYGTFGNGGKTLLAHRVAFALEHGREPVGCVLHRCDNSSCVRPYHLYEGTQAANMADRDARGRSGAPKRRGEKNGRAKLTLEQVAEIRASYVDGRRGPFRRSQYSQTALAAKYGVSQTVISLIVRGRIW
jgi:hypothetical protein